MFGSAVQKATKTKGSLAVLQEMPNHQKPLGYQTEATKKLGRWSIFGKFKVKSNKTQKTRATGDTTTKQKNAGQNQGLQTHTRHAIKNSKWKRINESKGRF